MKHFDLEDRLVDFSILIINIVEQTPKTRSGNHLAGQIIRSGTSTALNYGEAQGAESQKDFIHKMKVVLKELRETFINLKIMQKGKIYQDEELIFNTLKENNELISIFVKSVLTASKNN